MIWFLGDIIVGYVYGIVSLELYIFVYEYCFFSVNGRDRI